MVSAGGKQIFSSPKRAASFGAHPASYSMDICHLHLVDNPWNYAFTVSDYFEARCVIKQADERLYRLIRISLFIMLSVPLTTSL